MVEEELQRIIEEYENGRNILLTAEDLKEYVIKHGEEIKNEEAIKLCKTLAYQFVTKSMFDNARSLYLIFGMKEEDINIIIIKKAREGFGTEKRMEELRQRLHQ